MNAQQRIQRQLEEVLKMPGNDKCADCKASSPRWASINLGIFLCVTCASAHRKLGTHTSRVKSVTLDEWTRDQVTTMKEIGNTRSNAIYNPGDRHPAPTTTGGDERDSEISKYIRRKYELGAFKAGAAQSLAKAPVNSRALAQQARGRSPLEASINRDLPPIPQDPPARSSSRQRNHPPNPWSVDTSAATLAPPSQQTPLSTSPTSSLPPRSASSLSPVKPSAKPLVDVEGSTSSTRPLQLSTGNFPTIQVPPRPGFAPAPSPGLPAMSPLALGQQAFFSNTYMQPNMGGMGMGAPVGMAMEGGNMGAGMNGMNGMGGGMGGTGGGMGGMGSGMGGMGMGGGIGGMAMQGGMGGMSMSPNGGGMGMNMGYGMPVQQQYGQQYQWR